MVNAFDLQEARGLDRARTRCTLDGPRRNGRSDPSCVAALLLNPRLTLLTYLVCRHSRAVSAIAESNILRSFLKCADAMPRLLMSKLLASSSLAFPQRWTPPRRTSTMQTSRRAQCTRSPSRCMRSSSTSLRVRQTRSTGPDEDAVTAAAPAKSQRGHRGKAIQPRAVAKNRAPEWSWKDQIVPMLTLISKILRLKTSEIWTVSGERGTFIGCVISRPATTHIHS